MDLAFNIIIGNIISLIAGVFIILSMWVNDEKQAYKYQFLNAFILAISSVFFLSWTGVTTMAIAATRNAMVYYERLTFNWTIHRYFNCFRPFGKFYGICRIIAYYCNSSDYFMQLLPEDNQANQDRFHCKQCNLYSLFPGDT